MSHSTECSVPETLIWSWGDKGFFTLQPVAVRTSKIPFLTTLNSLGEKRLSAGGWRLRAACLQQESVGILALQNDSGHVALSIAIPQYVFSVITDLNLPSPRFL